MGMTHLERWRAAMNRNSFDRLPRFYSATAEFSASLEKNLGTDLDSILYDRFDIDYRFQNDGMEAKSWEPAYTGPEFTVYEDGSFDNIWGSRQKRMFHRDGRGAYVETFEYALGGAETAADVEAHRWPDPDWYDYRSIIPALESFPDYPFMVGYWAIGWFTWEVRGMEQSFTDFVLNPPVAEAITAKIADLGYEYFRRLLEAVEPYIGKNVVAIHIADDWGMQEGLIMNPDIFYTYYAPHYRRIIDLAHSYGLLVEFHSCGAARELYPGFIDVGVDIMNPVQTSAKGMVPHEIKAEFGRDLCFSGGVDVQQLLPNGSVREVRDQVKYLLDALGKGGGYLPGPAHNIQYGTPPENVTAVYEAMDEYYGTE
jgi:uroporphyrinogen decarboxylase